MKKATPAKRETVRPGLLNYSFYASSRQAQPKPQETAAEDAGRARRSLFIGLTLMVVVAAAVGVIRFGSGQSDANQNLSFTQTTPKTTTTSNTPAAATTPPSVCASNSLSKFIIVSISQRHMWACDQSSQVYDSPVITGMEMYAADLTPTGTYHIYGMYRNTTLTGHDTTGSWSDPVSYWMPWLHNRYGTYGFHDATWRPADAFGNVSPDSTNASHGCVELPLATAAWLYNWADIGTTLSIKS